MSAALDKVDFDILQCRLKTSYVGGSVHKWLTSFVTGRTAGYRFRWHWQHVITVPQGTVLAPLLFVLHAARCTQSGICR